jgi:hypothetical protein
MNYIICINRCELTSEKDLIDSKHNPALHCVCEKLREAKYKDWKRKGTSNKHPQNQSTNCDLNTSFLETRKDTPKGLRGSEHPGPWEVGDGQVLQVIKKPRLDLITV